MAVIHVTEAEAARDLHQLIEKVKAGEVVRIESGDATIAVVRHQAVPQARKTLSAAIKWAEEQDLKLTLDDQFARDLDQVICNHEHEAGSRTLWED